MTVRKAGQIWQQPDGSVYTILADEPTFNKDGTITFWKILEEGMVMFTHEGSMKDDVLVSEEKNSDT